MKVENLVNVSLAEYGPAMWFFEDGEHKAHLTFISNKGVQFDLNKLSINGIAYLIASVQGGHITTDIPLKKLLSILNKDVKEVPEEEKDTNPFEEKFLSSEARRQKRQDATSQRCEALVKSSCRAVKSGLAHETNQAILLSVLSLEKGNRNRKTIISFLEDRLTALRHKKLKEANKEEDSFTIQAMKPFMGYNDPEEEESELVDYKVVPAEKLEEETVGRRRI